MSFKAKIAKQKLKPSETVPYPLRLSLDGENQVVLFVKHAGESNRAYVNARRKLDSAFAVSPTPARLRELLTPLLTKHVIAGWEHVVEDDGKLCAYSAAKCEDFLATVIEEGGEDLFDGLFQFALNPNNFRAAPLGDAGDLGNG